MDFDLLEKKLNGITEELSESEKQLKEIAKNVYNKDNTNKEILKDVLDKDELNYFLINHKYKQWISQYSKEYIEMSEWYYGPELPYEIYCKEFKKVNKNTTYLDTPKDINELYFLFIFFAMYEYTLKEIS